jgi:hypothetical protein
MSAQRGSRDTSSWTNTWGPPGDSTVMRENPRNESSADASGATDIRIGAGASSTVYAMRSQEIARLVRIRTRGSSRTSTAERSSGIVFVFPAGYPMRGAAIAVFQPPAPSGTSRTGGSARRSARCESETLIDVSA